MAQIERKAAFAALGRLRKSVGRWEGVEESTNHSAPCFTFKKKTFVMLLDDHHGDGRLALWCKAPPGMQAMLVDADAERFFVPPYVGPKGWLGIRLDRGLAEAEVEELVRACYEAVLPAKRAPAKPRPKRAR